MTETDREYKKILKHSLATKLSDLSPTLVPD